MPRYLHTMYRITDPERSRAFYELLGFEFRKELPIVRDGELEATNYFFAMPGQDEELELTYNHDGRAYELGTAYGHIALAVDDMDTTLAGLAEHGVEPEKPPYRVREGGSLLCFVRDPDGYRIELIDRSGK
jgi:lactoylglutathione lyase